MAKVPANAPRGFAYQPFPGPQTLAYTTIVREMLFGGAMGGGKTALALGKFLPLVAKFGAAAKGVIFRQSYPELEQVIDEGQRRFVKTGWAEWMAGDKVFRFYNGAIYYVRQIEDYRDVHKQQGKEWCLICWDELGNFPDHRIIEEVNLRLRSPLVPDKFWQIFYTSNPGGPLHNWIVNRFAIDRYPEGNQILETKDGIQRVYIKSRVTDNLALANTTYARDLANTSDPTKRKAYFEGDWNFVAGGMFEGAWSEKTLVDITEPVPRHWPIYRSMDWGSAEPFAVQWWTITNEDVCWCKKFWPKGAIVIFREWYGMVTGLPNVGLRMTADAVGQGIAQREERWGIQDRVQPGPADTAMWTQDGGPSHHDRIYEGSGEKVSFFKAFKSRAVGWAEMRRRLLGGDKGPLLYYDRVNCPHCIRTIPILKRSERDLDDIMDGQEDHHADVSRMLSAQFIRPAQSIPEYQKELMRMGQRSKASPVIDDTFGY